MQEESNVPHAETQNSEVCLIIEHVFLLVNHDVNRWEFVFSVLILRGKYKSGLRHRSDSMMFLDMAFATQFIWISLGF